MAVENIQNIMKLALISNMMKSKSDDSGVFDIIMYSLLGSMSNNTGYNSTPLTNFEDIETVLNNNLVANLNSNKLDNIDTSNKVSITSENKNADATIDMAVKNSAQKYGIDENLIKSIIKKESSFNPNAVSSAGAKGLMQIMPFNFKSLGITDPFNIEQNIEAGTKLLKQYLDKFDGNIEMGLMAYNAGPGTMKKRGVNSPNELYKMPKETQHYVPKVMSYYRG
jgi:soluble lytic murein transglycosylase-like protein